MLYLLVWSRPIITGGCAKKYLSDTASLFSQAAIRQRYRTFLLQRYLPEHHSAVRAEERDMGRLTVGSDTYFHLPRHVSVITKRLVHRKLQPPIPLARMNETVFYYLPVLPIASRMPSWA